MPYKARGGRGVGNLAQNERKHKMVLDFPSLILNVVPPPFFFKLHSLKGFKISATCERWGRRKLHFIHLWVPDKHKW